MNSLPPVDRRGLADTLRNFLYPSAIIIAIAIVWMVGWASSIEARANSGYWTPLRTRTFMEQSNQLQAADKTEHQPAVASIADNNE